MKRVGIDLGTNSLCSAIAINEVDAPTFKLERDCFYIIKPKTDVNRSSIKMSLDKRGVKYVINEDDTYIVIGHDALDIAIERNDVVQRPMQKGVISPKEKTSLPMLKLMIENMIGKGDAGDVCMYSVPAKPIDGDFDIVYHSEIMRLCLTQMGYEAKPINEAYAVALSELLDDELTGITLSFGAGQTNVCVVLGGDPLIEFSLARGGDYIDQSVSNALDIPCSIVQLDKESGTDLYNPGSKLMEAVSVYYTSLLNYVFNNIVYELKKREKEIPLFKKPISIIVSGGLSLAIGFVQKVEEVLGTINFPIKIKEVRRAVDPMKAVAQGALLATTI